jgi:hypothetical protein
MLKPVFAIPVLLLAAAPAVATGPDVPEAPSWDRARALMAQHITIHVPRVTVMSSTTTFTVRPTAPPAYREKKADDCLKLKKVVGYAVSSANPNSVDLILDDGSRMRAKLGSNCPALGFYSGFYMKPNPDGKMCVRRDVMRGRAGTACSIDAFAKLVPVR